MNAQKAKERRSQTDSKKKKRTVITVHDSDLLV